MFWTRIEFHCVIKVHLISKIVEDTMRNNSAHTKLFENHYELLEYHHKSDELFDKS